MTTKPTLFLTRRLPEPTMDRLAKETNLIHGDLDQPLSRDQLIEGVRKADALICLLTDKVDGEVMDANPNLKVVANYAVGYNNIDVEAATQRNIAVTNTPDVLTDATADIAWALLLSASRRLVEGDSLVRSKSWQGWGPLQLLGSQVTGSTIGFVGFGRIGQATAKRAHAFGMKVLYWNRTRLPLEKEIELGVEYRELDDLWPECDFVSLHVAYTPQTHHLVSSDQFKRMKSTATIINTARGAVIDEKALVRALQGGDIARAGLDVYENEPQLEQELYSLPNAVLAPHLGSATVETRVLMGEMVVNNCLAVYRGDRGPNQVN